MQKSKSNIALIVLGACMIAAGFIMFVVNGITSVSSFGKSFNPIMLVISVVLFMGGAIMLAITFSISAKSRMKNMIGGDETSDDSFFGQTLSTIKKQIEKENLELDKEIQELKSEKRNKRKCPNCGASNLDQDGSCPYCGN